MPRYALKIEYDGRPFCGWQRQDGQPSVQQSIEDALRALEADHPGIFGAGRTDTGVHATGQVAHVDLQQGWEPFRLSEALNFHLKPHPVAILQCAQVDAEFHARFSAIERSYLFRIVQRRAPLTFESGLAWRVKHELDVDAMRAGAAHLVGKHDFTTFRSTMCQAKSPVKTLDEVRVEAVRNTDSTDFRFYLRARSFLHNQVRSIVGSLERVGAGAWAPDRIGDALAARDRAACGPVSPPDGLYLTEVRYADFQWP